jgi:hypothetical protein
MPSLFRLACGGLFFGQALAHSWIEQMVNIDSNGKYFGEYGYPRAFADKGIPGFNQQSDLYMLPPLTRQPPYINNADPLCHPSQRNQTQSANFPRLQVAPSGMFAMKYAENGHVTQPAQLPGKPKAGGTNFVFGTTQPKDDEKLADVMQWTQDGSGGDKRGVLLSTENFDDGRCYQISGFPISVQRQKEFADPIHGQVGSQHEQLCETDVQLPSDAAAGKPYTLYWVWQWPTEGGVDPNIPKGKDEYYITCMDVDVVASVKSVTPSKTLAQQDPQTAAVTNFKSRTAFTTNPISGELGTVFGSATGQKSAATTIATSVTSNTPTITNSVPTGGNDGLLEPTTVTITEMVTVTAPLTIATVAPRDVPSTEDNNARVSAHFSKNGSAKFRGRL